MVEVIKEKVQGLMSDEKPALIIFREGESDFSGFLNDKALMVVEGIEKGAKYFFCLPIPLGKVKIILLLWKCQKNIKLTT